MIDDSAKYALDYEMKWKKYQSKTKISNITYLTNQLLTILLQSARKVM